MSRTVIIKHALRFTQTDLVFAYPNELLCFDHYEICPGPVDLEYLRNLCKYRRISRKRK